MLAGLYNVGVVIERGIENGTNVFVEQKCDGENNQSKLGWMSGKAETSKYGGKGGKCVGNKTKRVYKNKKNDSEAFSENAQQTPLISKNRGTLPLKNPVGVLRILPNKAHDIKKERNLMRSPFS